MILVNPFQLSIFYGSMIYRGLSCLVYVWWFKFAAGHVEGSTGPLDVASQTTAPSAFSLEPQLCPRPHLPLSLQPCPSSPSAEQG